MLLIGLPIIYKVIIEAVNGHTKGCSITAVLLHCRTDRDDSAVLLQHFVPKQTL